MGKKHSFMLLQICFARSERSGIPVFFFSFLLFFTKSRAFNDNFQKKSVVFISSRRRRARTEKRRALAFLVLGESVFFNSLCAESARCERRLTDEMREGL